MDLGNLSAQKTASEKVVDHSETAGQTAREGVFVRGHRCEMTSPKKIFEGEFSLYFAPASNRNKKRKLLKNAVIISEMAVQELIERIARLFAPSISGAVIFENFISRKQKSIEVKKKLIRLHTRISDYFTHKGSMAAAEIFADISQFMETDLNYLLYKDWNDFYGHYQSLSRAEVGPTFDPALRAFHSFLTHTLKEIVSEKR